MKITPYLNFNGNCSEAIAFYEEAFGVKAKIMRYCDAPPIEGFTIQPGTENFVMHACLTNRDDYTIFLADVTPNMRTAFGDGMSISIELDGADTVKSAFDKLKEGGTVLMELQKTFWSEFFGSLVDKFGVSWMIMAKM
ncbi:MAG: VOC family protein [Gracilibacteraceae bacterium]|jgi:PhnB protein|nr:VOC family protein [Gracilibacteraceae bacterium]